MTLSRKGKIFGVKAETESEGLDWNAITYLRILSEKVQLPFSLKIGGVEAVTDLVSATFLDVDSVVAPMVESSFSVQKFKKAVQKSGIEGIEKKILIETVGGLHSLPSILTDHRGWLDGVNFGRTDLLGSLNSATKGNQSIDTRDFVNLLGIGIQTAKSHSLPVTLGGQVTTESLQGLLEVEPDFQPDFVETRRFILPFKEIASDNSLLEEVLSIERILIRRLLNFSALKVEALVSYSNELSKRLKAMPEEFEVL
jgi:hypothetical protein